MCLKVKSKLGFKGTKDPEQGKKGLEAKNSYLRVVFLLRVNVISIHSNDVCMVRKEMPHKLVRRSLDLVSSL